MDDLISRKALIEKHCAENCGCTRDECGLTYEEDGCDACTFVKEVEEAPTIDAEIVRHGEWEDVDYVYFGPKSYVCSLCKDERYWMERFHYSKENYCPNCGACMMDGGAGNG